MWEAKGATDGLDTVDLSVNHRTITSISSDNIPQTREVHWLYVLTSSPDLRTAMADPKGRLPLEGEGSDEPDSLQDEATGLWLLSARSS